MSDDLDLDPQPQVPVYLPVLVATVSALFGAIVGGVVGWWAHGASVEPPEEVQVDVVRDYSEEELQVACLPYMRQTATTLEEAETRVEALAVQVRTKEEEVARLERALSSEKGRAGSLSGQLAKAKSELGSLTGELEQAEADRERLLLELEETKDKLSVTRTRLVSETARSERAEEEALDQRWTQFQASAQLEVCEKGTRVRLDRCREAVATVMDNFEDRFKGCVRGDQAIPQVVFDPTADNLPRYSAWLDNDNRDLRGWYVEFCDPMLPEAGGL